MRDLIVIFIGIAATVALGAHVLQAYNAPKSCFETHIQQKRIDSSDGHEKYILSTDKGDYETSKELYLRVPLKVFIILFYTPSNPSYITRFVSLL